MLQARLLRVRRSARAKAQNGTLGFTGHFGTADDGAAEDELSARLIDGLRKEPVSGGKSSDASKKMVETILDAQLFDDLTEELFLAVTALVTDVQVKDRLTRSISKNLFRRCGVPDGTDPLSVENQNRARLAGINDVVPLVMEEILKRVFKGVRMVHDELREVSPHHYADAHIAFEGPYLRRADQGGSKALSRNRIRRLSQAPSVNPEL